MRWTARIGDRLAHVELTRRAGGGLHAVVDGRPYVLDLTEPQSNVYSILSEGRSFEALIQVRQGRCRVRLAGRDFEISPDEGPRFSPGGAQAGGRLVVTAVMPGRVLRVLVTAGERVEARQGLLVLEAMKMENEVVAPRAGSIAEVKVAPGRTVEVGESLVVLE